MDRKKRTGTGRWAMAGLLLGILIVTAAGSSCSGPETKVVAEVNGRKITVGDVVLQYRSMSVTTRPFIDTLEGKRGFVNDIVNKELMLIEAEARGLAELPEVTETVRDFESQLLAEKYYAVTIHDRVTLTEEDLRSLYEMEGEEARLRLIMTATGDEAHRLKERLDAGADFTSLAREHSVDPTGRRGGDLGFHTWADYPPEVSAAGRDLPIGGVSDVIPYEENFALVRVEARRPTPQGDFESERKDLELKMRAIIEARMASEWSVSKRAEAQIEVNPETVAYLSERMVEALEHPIQFMGQAPLRIPDADRELELVRFAGHAWTLDDYLYRLRGIPLKLRPALSASHGEIADFVASLATREVAIDEARAMGLQEEPDVAEAVDRYRERQILNVLHRELTRVEPPDEEEVARYYEQHRASLIMPARAKIKRAVLRTEEDARNCLTRIRRGETTLTRVIEEESIDLDEAARGGISDWIYRSSDPDALTKAVFNTELQRTGGPVHVRGEGWVIFRLREMEGEAAMTVDEARETIQMKLVEERRTQLFDEWLSDQREQSDIEIYDEVIREIDFGAPPRPDLEPTEGEESPTPVFPS